MIIPSIQSADVTAAPLLDVGRGNQPLKSEILSALTAIIDTNRFVGGPHCAGLEQAVAEVTSAKHAIGCASGSDALLLALMALELQAGDEVIMPSFTFFATASAVTRLGGVPVFVDICHDSFNIDAAKIESQITDKTKAIIPVHLFGQCAEMDEIMEIAERHKLHVIEDCAQSIGAIYKGQPSGSIGTVGCFSFYPTKNLGGMGDGGMMTANDEQVADRLRLYANHGMRPRYHHQVVGINSRLDSMQAAILEIKMKHLQQYTEKRNENAARYVHLMTEYGLTDKVALPSTNAAKGDGSVHVWNQFTIRIPNGQRDQVRAQLSEMNVGSEIYYPIPVHQQACYQYLDQSRYDLPETELAAKEVLALPIFPELTPAEQEYTVRCLAKILNAGQYQYRKAS